MHLFSKACWSQSEGSFFLTFVVYMWEEEAELCLVGLFLWLPSYGRSSTGEVSFLSIRSHVAFVLNHRRRKNGDRRVCVCVQKQA